MLSVATWFHFKTNIMAKFMKSPETTERFNPQSAQSLRNVNQFLIHTKSGREITKINWGLHKEIRSTIIPQ